MWLHMVEYGVSPRVNVFSDSDGYVVRVEVPGLSPDHLNVEVQDRTLTIGGKRDPNEANGSFHRRERSRGEFSRSLELPEQLDLSKTEASYRHGVLTLRIPTCEEAKPRQIPIRSEAA
jgi:HSP20 family protein